MRKLSCTPGLHSQSGGYAWNTAGTFSQLCGDEPFLSFPSLGLPHGTHTQEEAAAAPFKQTLVSGSRRPDLQASPHCPAF